MSDRSLPDAITTFYDKKNNKKIYIESRCDKPTAKQCNNSPNDKYTCNCVDDHCHSGNNNYTHHNDMNCCHSDHECIHCTNNKCINSNQGVQNSCCNHGPIGNKYCINEPKSNYLITQNQHPDSCNCYKNVRVCNYCGTKYTIPSCLDEHSFLLPCGHIMLNHSNHCQQCHGAPLKLVPKTITYNEQQLGYGNTMQANAIPLTQKFYANNHANVQSVPYMQYAQRIEPTYVRPTVYPTAQIQMPVTAMTGTPGTVISPQPVQAGAYSVPVVGKRSNKKYGTIQMQVPDKGFVTVPYNVQ